MPDLSAIRPVVDGFEVDLAEPGNLGCGEQLFGLCASGHGYKILNIQRFQCLGKNPAYPGFSDK